MLILECPCFPHKAGLAAGLISCGYSVAINAEKIVRYRSDPEMRGIIDCSVLPYPDGFGAVLGLRLLHGVRAQKINMPIEVLRFANANKLKVYLLGSEEWVNKKAFDIISQRYPRLVLVGRKNGFNLQYDEVLAELKSCSPNIVLIAMGSPKQESLAARFVADGVQAFFVGCGGALDAMIGKIKRAPDFMVNNGLEWLYRLYKEPWRWRRQLVLFNFLGLLFIEVLRTKIIKILHRANNEQS